MVRCQPSKRSRVGFNSLWMLQLTATTRFLKGMYLHVGCEAVFSVSEAEAISLLPQGPDVVFQWEGSIDN